MFVNLKAGAGYHLVFERDTGIVLALGTAQISLEICCFSIQKFCPDTVWRLWLFVRSFQVLNKAYQGYNAVPCGASQLHCGSVVCFLYCTCAQAAGSWLQLNLCSETFSWSHASWDWTLFPTASSTVWVAANTCMVNIHAPHAKRNCLSPFLASGQLQRQSIQEALCGLSLPPLFSAAKSKLSLKKTGYQEPKGAGPEKT